MSGRLSEDNQTLLLLVRSALLVRGIGAEWLGPPMPDPMASMGLVVAMAWLNAAHRLDSRLGAPFTVMTGNVTSIALELAYTLKIGKREETPNTTKPNASPQFRMLYLVLSFAVGCALGALSQRCFLYTSDAADDLHCVDLGVRLTTLNIHIPLSLYTQ